MPFSRRSILGAGLATGVLASAAPEARPPARPKNLQPEALARDEGYWRSVASQYDVTREVVQLENGNWGMMARPVLAAYERHERQVNKRNSFYVRREYGDDLARIRARVAAELGVQVEEIALTRGATEALQAVIGGYNRLRPGDAVLYADLDYDSMQAAMNWLRARRGVDVIKIDLPEPATTQSLIDAYAAALDAHPRVRLILLTHLSHRTGLVLPVREIVAMARARGVDAIVDSAHAWGQIDFSLNELGMDFVGLNLHKWIGAPVGVGALFIRRTRIADVDAFMANDEVPADDVRARVHSGTANFAAFLAVPDALDFHQAIGVPAKEARLRYLRDLWAERLRGRNGIEILTPRDPRLYGGITSFRLAGRGRVAENAALARELLDRFRIFTVHRTGVAAGACVRVTPALFNSPADMYRLAEAVEQVALSTA
jgi:selenocysteine lyase/cysteine desulfurase